MARLVSRLLLLFAISVVPALGHAVQSCAMESIQGLFMTAKTTDGCTTTASPQPKLKVKSEAELDRYVNCYLSEPGGIEAYRKYEPLIKAAAREFGIPKTLFTCLLFRESRFNNKARSSSGALGLGQFTNDGASFVSTIISAGNEARPKMKQYMEIAQAPKNPRDASNRQFAENKLAFGVLADKWNNYFSTLHSLKKYPSQTAPTKFSKKIATDPVLAIGASALYLRYIMDELQEQIEKTTSSGAKLLPPEKNLDLLLTAVGAYNLGPGRALSLAGRSKSNNATVWVDRLKKDKDETKYHITSIANCAANSETDPSSAYQPMHQDKPQDCLSPERLAAVASVEAVEAKQPSKSPKTNSRVNEEGKMKSQRPSTPAGSEKRKGVGK